MGRRVDGAGRRWRRKWVLALVAIASLILILSFWPRPSDPPTAQVSKYAIALESPFNQPEHYPTQQAVDRSLYRPVGDWVGRLILPSEAEVQQETPRDWVWLEVYQAPDADWIGQRVRLEWSSDPAIQDYVSTVTRGIQFTEDTIENQLKGSVHPTRLNGWAQVGPLQSLAGARSIDDVIVSLAAVTVGPAENAPVTLQIGAMPTQVPERFYGLVQVIGSANNYPRPERCPGRQPCPSDYMRVRHYNPASSAFDGREEIVRIPQVLPTPDGIFQSTPRQLAESPAGEAGWYIYGAADQQGVFTVRAIAPRRLFQLQPQNVITEPEAALNYINFGNWRDTPERKGTIQSVLLDVDASTEQSIDWQIGDRALVMHLFGGIGGQNAETPPVFGTVSGHFAYGVAEMRRDPFTQEPRLEVVYDQVYSHNPNGIIAGRLSWAEYTGSLQRGWLGTRPISDVLIKLPALTKDYQFGEITLSPFAELQRQLAIMMARYRTGDGTGAAIVTPAQSCIQDSSQAVYKTIKQIEQRLQNTLEIQQWLAEHPDDPQTQRFQKLLALGQTLARELVPLAIVRPDWQQNAEILAGIDTNAQFETDTNLITELLSWRTVIPRVAHDQVAMIMLNYQAELWFLRTNQVGGWDGSIIPLAPTELFGQFFIIPTAFSRIIESLKWPTLTDWGFAIAVLLLYACIALPQGLRQGFLRYCPPAELGLSIPQQVKLMLLLFLMPALLEELVMRVLLLPHPTEGVLPQTWLIWSVISLVIFVVYHPLNALTFYPAGNPTFFQPIFLVLSGLLGLVCTVIYLQTGSLWLIAIAHWLVVVIWILWLGGYQKMRKE
ncbi:MAG: CPBP family glutamic-type intramembrane protease [Thainema sp.]